MEYFTSAHIEQMLEGAIRLLEEIGVELTNETYLKKLEAKGFKLDKNRVKIGRSRALQQIEAVRNGPKWENPKRRPFGTHISSYSHMYENHNTGEFSEITDNVNQRMGQMVNHITKDYPGLFSNCPGHPVDVPADLQIFKQAINSYIWCEGFSPYEPMSVKIAPYQFEVCEIMGTPYEGLPVYVASPMVVAGESFDIVMQNAHKLKSVWVCSMPAFGANTPLNLIAAYAQTLAETIGGAVVVEELTGLKATFGNNIFPFDFYDMSMPFGTPEKCILELMNFEVSAKIAGQENLVFSTDIHTNAPRSGIQAAAEKASLIMAGALHGSCYFHTVGTIGMDEVFSPLQLILDLEILQHVEKIIDGLPVEEYTDDIVEEVRAGLGAGYVQSDRTLDNFREYSWHPRFFNRASFGAYIKNDLKDAEEKARDYLNALESKAPGWKLDDEREKAICEVYEKAAKTLE